MAVRTYGYAGSNPAQEAGLKLFPFGEAWQTGMTQNVVSFDGTFHCSLEHSEYPMTGISCTSLIIDFNSPFPTSTFHWCHFILASKRIPACDVGGRGGQSHKHLGPKPLRTWLNCLKQWGISWSNHPGKGVDGLLVPGKGVDGLLVQLGVEPAPVWVAVLMKAILQPHSAHGEEGKVREQPEPVDENWLIPLSSPHCVCFCVMSFQGMSFTDHRFHSL